MKPRIIIFIISLIALAIFYGCGSHSSNALFVNPQNDVVITSKEAIIDKLGRLPSVTFPSGAKFEALNENTLTPGIKVQLIEQKITSKNIGYFSDSSSFSCSFIYGINAFQNSTNLSDSKVYATTVEKPFKVTLPKNQNKQGIVFVGIKESDTNPWRFFSLSDSSEILAKISNIRLSEISSNECTFEIFRLGTQLALVTCDDNIDNRFPETIVSNLNASSTSYILIKDGKYLDDLTLKCIFKGLKLNSIKPSDFRARITYRNNIAKTSIKVNGANVVQTNKADNTVPGYSYVHSFEIDSLSDFNLMNSDGEVAFILNLKGVEIQSFSSGFLIEFFNKVNSEKILPYSYTEFYTLNKAESVNLALISNDGNLADETNNFYILNPTFSVTSSYDFGDIDKEKIAKAISVSNVDSEKISKVWNDKTLTLSFNENLETETLYTISIADVNDIEGLSISTFEDFTFTTRPENKIEIYNIEYDYNGGNVETQNPTTYYLGSSTFTLNNPTKEGYDFIGWSGTDLSGNNNLVVSIEQGSTGNRTYTANYKPTVYNINYELNEGQILANNPVSYDITSPTITLNNPVKDGYRFIGWTGSNGDEPQISVTIDTGSTGDKSFTANYLALDYLIICNLDGGVLETPNPSGYNKASDSITLNNPTKYGYEFIGWTNEEIFIPQMIVTIEKGSTGDKTYTANYTAINYPIVYILDGGNFETTNPESYDICSETIILNNPIKEGFTFVGWTSEDITTPQKTVIIEKGSTGSKTFTANWSLFSYKVTLNKGKGIAEVSGDGVYGYGSQVIASCTMLEGYEFDFWTGNNTEPNFTMPNNDVVMQANAKPINYSIECDLKEGNLTTDNINSYNIDSDNITLINPTRLGYTFTGWTGTDLDSASMTLSIPQGSIGNRAYTANWVLATYTITYNVGDGNVESPNFTTYYITSENIILNNPVSTRDYYLFKGWSGTELEGNENLVVTIPQGSVGDREYTANYAPESFQINYEYDGVMSENPESYDITTLSFLLNNPTKEGYDFLGWEGTDIPIGTASKTVIIYKGSVGQRNYVASYTKRYSIDYELDGGNVLVSNPDSYNIYTDTIALNNPTKEGFDFLGWEGDSIPQGTASKTVFIYKGWTGDRSYVASFTKRYTIDYDLTGGSILASNPDSYNIYTDNIILNNPTKENCDFLGWTGTDIPEGTASKTVVIYKGSEGNRQYIASFTEKYTITYNLNGGTTSNPLSYNKHTNTFTLTTPTRTGETSADFYVFLGWSGTDLASITTTVTIPQGSTGNREFTAHWREGKSFELSPGISLDLVKCPAGTFFMGSPAEELERGVNESQHKVTLSQDFYMGVYEVTQEQYFAVMGTNPSNFKDNPADEKPTTSANQPVETVKWADAKNFCAWLNTNITSGVPADYHFDLPTEAQWEYACRAGTTTTLNNGTNVINPTLSTYDQNLNEVAWFKSISLNTTHPVGEKKPNNWGLYDMHGNVQEWCLDKRSSNWETDDYPTAPVIDPVKTTGDQYIIRGGDYQSTPNKRYRSAARDGKGISSSFNYVGFRVVLVSNP